MCAIVEDIKLKHRWGQADENLASRHISPQITRQSAPRFYHYVRNSVNGLRQRHMPLRWKLQQMARMTAQLSLALLRRKPHGILKRLVWRALRDGWNNRLGPMPEEVSNSIKDLQT